MIPKGSSKEKSEPCSKFQLLPPSGCLLSQTATLQHCVALLPANRAFTLELASPLELKHPLAYTITSTFSIWALSIKNLRKASSIRSPRKSWTDSMLMLDVTHLMAPDSFQNLMPSLPVDSVVFLDCTSVKPVKNGRDNSLHDLC